VAYNSFNPNPVLNPEEATGFAKLIEEKLLTCGIVFVPKFKLFMLLFVAKLLGTEGVKLRVFWFRFATDWP
jgi:hypothetical protein